MVERLVVWNINSLINVGYFTPQVILSGIVNRGIQRTGEIKKDPDRGRKLYIRSLKIHHKPRDKERPR